MTHIYSHGNSFFTTKIAVLMYSIESRCLNELNIYRRKNKMLWNIFSPWSLIKKKCSSFSFRLCNQDQPISRPKTTLFFLNCELLKVFYHTLKFYWSLAVRHRKWEAVFGIYQCKAHFTFSFNITQRNILISILVVTLNVCCPCCISSNVPCHMAGCAVKR